MKKAFLLISAWLFLMFLNYGALAFAVLGLDFIYWDLEVDFTPAAHRGIFVLFSLMSLATVNRYASSILKALSKKD